MNRMRLVLVLALLVFGANPAGRAPHLAATAPVQGPSAKTALTVPDVLAWKSMSGVILSNDGKWIASARTTAWPSCRT